jgi:hypothetical protein
MSRRWRIVSTRSPVEITAEDQGGKLQDCSLCRRRESHRKPMNVPPCSAARQHCHRSDFKNSCSELESKIGSAKEEFQKRSHAFLQKCGEKPNRTRQSGKKYAGAGQAKGEREKPCPRRTRRTGTVAHRHPVAIPLVMAGCGSMRNILSIGSDSLSS